MRRQVGLQCPSCVLTLPEFLALSVVVGKSHKPLRRLTAVLDVSGTPDVVIRWGHPFFMSFVLLVMGGTVAAQGWQIRTSTDGAAVSKARSQHPKLAIAMGLFFAIGAFGGMGSVIAQGQPLLARLLCSPFAPALCHWRLNAVSYSLHLARSCKPCKPLLWT